MGTAYDRVMDGANKVHEKNQAPGSTALEVIMSVRVILLENGHKANKMLNVLREYLNRTEKKLMNEREQASVDMVEGFNRAKKDSEMTEEMGTESIAKSEDSINQEDVMEKNWKAKGINLKELDRLAKLIRNLYLGQPSETGRQMIMLSLDAIKDSATKRIEGQQGLDG